MLAAASKADAAIDAPPFGTIAQRILIACVEGVCRAREELHALRDIESHACSREPIGVEGDALVREGFEVRVDAVAGVGQRHTVGQAASAAVCGDGPAVLWS